MKLDGVRVIDLSLFLPGPYLTMRMADQGAEVIKVEPPGEGDPARHIGLGDEAGSVFFRNLNRGKKSVVVDLKAEGGREALLRLCEGADVFVESFRPGVVTRLGVDYEQVKARNPRIVYCSISAFGQDGPYRARPAHDLAVQALAGSTGVTVGRDGTPALTGIPAADILAALNGLSAVMMALFRRERTGRGDFIDISMQDAVLSAYPNIWGPAFVEHRDLVPTEERSLGGAAFHNVYATRDGRHLALGGQEIKFVRNLLGALGRLDLVALAERGPGPHQRPLIDFLGATFATRSLAEWVAWFEGRDVCFAPVATLREALDDPQARHRGMHLRDARGRDHIGSPIAFRDEPARLDLSLPRLGAHTQEVLGSGEPQ
jgi:crotonobetainyl-CoA:carnitine CoA-transferase CaiB-like acyl-CoA transferase